MAKGTTHKPPSTEENNVDSMFNGEMNIKTEVKIEEMELEYDTSELFLEQTLLSALRQNNNETFELYADHIIKDELVVGPELIQEKPMHKEDTTETIGINPNKEKLHECKECNANFLNRLDLTIHLKIAHPFTTTCKYCGMIFTHRPNMLQHQMYNCKIIKKLHVCKECNSNFLNKLDLTKHYKIAHQSIIKCKYCGMSFTLRPNMLRHQKNICKMNKEKKPNQTRTRYKCNECDKIYSDRQSIVNHLKMLHMVPQNSHVKGLCKFCGRIFSKLSNLNRHEIYGCKKNKHKKKYTMQKETFTNLICDYCKKEFTHKQSLIVHMRQHVGGVIKFSCPFCKKQYTKKHNLTCHINGTHLNLKLYACKHCSSKFTWKHSLTCHEKKYHHNKIKMF